MTQPGGGPLAGVRIIELAGQGPGPFACALLAGLGAEVISVERPGTRRHGEDSHARGRRSVCLDLKHPSGRAVVLDLVETADVLIEGFRPGVTERMGLGPEIALALNPQLVYGRMTGWGQDGPLARTAGHDLNYLALSGVLDAIGPAGGAPVVPSNLVADYGAGGMLLAFGVGAALAHVRSGGPGQVVDAAMVDGLGAMAGVLHALDTRGEMRPRGTNLLDGGAPFYAVYRTADDRYLSLGSMEPAFHAEMLDVLGIDPDRHGAQHDRALWPAQRDRIAAVVAGRTLADWEQAFEGREACAAPVLTLAEARVHPHATARQMFEDADGIAFPAPAPRFSRTPAAHPARREELGASTEAVLRELHRTDEEIAALRAAGVLGAKTHAWAEVRHDGEVTARADGFFLATPGSAHQPDNPPLPGGIR